MDLEDYNAARARREIAAARAIGLLRALMRAGLIPAEHAEPATELMRDYDAAAQCAFDAIQEPSAKP